jgi:hypothetical protein
MNRDGKWGIGRDEGCAESGEGRRWGVGGRGNSNQEILISIET